MTKLEEFKHKIAVTVRFNEVDMLGVCNNAVYLNYFEHARLQYIKDLGLIPNGKIFSDGKLFFMVRNELNYRKHSFYDEPLTVYTKIAYIKNSSYGFEHIITNSDNHEIKVEGSGVVVQVDPNTKKSCRLSDEFINRITDFEGEVKILRE